MYDNINTKNNAFEAETPLMYDNIGKKIKGLAMATCFIGIMAAVIYGLVLISLDEDFILFGILIMLIGSLVAWISSLCLYGFGELIEKTCAIELSTRNGAINSDSRENEKLERVNKIEKLRSQGLISEEEYRQAISKEQ